MQPIFEKSDKGLTQVVAACRGLTHAVLKVYGKTNSYFIALYEITMSGILTFEIIVQDPSGGGM